MYEKGINKYQHTSALHGNQGLQSIVLLHDQALAALARAKDILPQSITKCDVELCEAATHLLAISEIIENTSFVKLADTIARFMNGVVIRIHRVTSTPKPATTIDEIVQSITILKKQWQDMANEADRLQSQTSQVKNSGSADIKI